MRERYTVVDSWPVMQFLLSCRNTANLVCVTVTKHVQDFLYYRTMPNGTLYVKEIGDFGRKIGNVRLVVLCCIKCERIHKMPHFRLQYRVYFQKLK